MLESRWIRWVGPGVIVALGVLGSLATATQGAGPAPWTAAAVRRTGTARRRPPRGRPSPSPWATFGSRAVVSPRSAARPERRSAGPAAGRRHRRPAGRAAPSTCPPSPSRPVRSGGSSWSGHDDGATSTAHRHRRRRRLLVGDRRRNLRSSGGRRSTPPAGRSTRSGWIARRGPTSACGRARWTAPAGGPGTRTDRCRRAVRANVHAPSSPGTPGGDRLAVQSCGEAACRTRVIDPASGRSATVAEPDLGTLVGVRGRPARRLRGLPGAALSDRGVDLTSRPETAGPWPTPRRPRS